jgi:hypothetical protein
VKHAVYFWFSWVRASQITYSNIYPTRCNVTQFIYIWKLLYMFRVLLPPIIRIIYNSIYSIWYLSHQQPLGCSVCKAEQKTNLLAFCSWLWSFEGDWKWKKNPWSQMSTYEVICFRGTSNVSSYWGLHVQRFRIWERLTWDESWKIFGFDMSKSNGTRVFRCL